MRIKKYLSNIEDLSNRKIVLTGATSGIGEACLYHLLSKNAEVICLVHSYNKVEEFKKKIFEKYPNAKVDFLPYDQSSLKDIERTVDDLLVKHPDFDTVILDAGVLTSKGRTVDDYPLSIGVNYIGVRHFIDYLSPKISHNLRFVIQGSIVAFASVNKKDDLRKQYGVFKQYNISKGYIEAYFYKLYKENKYPNIEYVLTEPGISNTRITRHFNKFVRVGGHYFLMMFNTPIKASLPLLLGATSKAKNGDYITPRCLFTLCGYPKIKKFPNRRKREYLFDNEEQ